MTIHFEFKITFRPHSLEQYAAFHPRYGTDHIIYEESDYRTNTGPMLYGI
jgi:hypothetical protein